MKLRQRAAGISRRETLSQIGFPGCIPNIRASYNAFQRLELSSGSLRFLAIGLGELRLVPAAEKVSHLLGFTNSAWLFSTGTLN